MRLKWIAAVAIATASALPPLVMAQEYYVFYGTAQIIEITGQRDIYGCWANVSDPAVTVSINCITRPMGAAEYYYGNVLPAVVASPAVTIAQKCEALANAFKEPCRRAGEEASTYSLRAVNACTQSVSDSLPVSFPLNQRTGAAFFACNARRSLYYDNALFDHVTPC